MKDFNEKYEIVKDIIINEIIDGRGLCVQGNDIISKYIRNKISIQKTTEIRRVLNCKRSIESLESLLEYLNESEVTTAINWLEENGYIKKKKEEFDLFFSIDDSNPKEVLVRCEKRGSNVGWSLFAISKETKQARRCYHVTQGLGIPTQSDGRIILND